MVKFTRLSVVKKHDELFSIVVGLWAGWTDEENEGTFIDPNSGEHLNISGGYAPFITGEPNGAEAENCVVKLTDEINLIDRFWWDYSCDDESIASCYLEQSPTTFHLRGMILNGSQICQWVPTIVSSFQGCQQTSSLMMIIQLAHHWNMTITNSLALLTALSDSIIQEGRNGTLVCTGTNLPMLSLLDMTTQWAPICGRLCLLPPLSGCR